MNYGEAIVFTSGKGGVGKTTSAISIGAALSRMGKRVVLVDMDLGLRKLDITLGVNDQLAYDIFDVISERCTLYQGLFRDSRYYELYILPASYQPLEDKDLSEQIVKIVTELKKDFDYVLIDSPAGIGRNFTYSVSAADRALIVVTPDRASLRDGDRVADLLFENGVKNIKLLINHYRYDLAESGEIMNIEEIINTLKIGIIGVVVEDDSVIKANYAGRPVLEYTESPAAACFSNIASRIMGEDIPLYELGRVKKRGFLRRLLFKKGEK